MQGGPRRPGPPLPYELLAGVVPVEKGWVVATAKIQGIQLYPNEPELLTSLEEVLDYRPSFRVIALGCPVGLYDEPVQGGRKCDHEARKLLGWPRAGAILVPPIRKALDAPDYETAAQLSGGLGAVTWRMRHRIAEVDREMAPYRQRQIFEVHPELSLYQLNDDEPMRYPKRTVNGQNERTALLKGKIGGMERIIDADIPGVRRWQLIDAAACLWTTRRIASRAMTRIPEDPEWDETGLRMELVR